MGLQDAPASGVQGKSWSSTNARSAAMELHSCVHAVSASGRGSRGASSASSCTHKGTTGCAKIKWVSSDISFSQRQVQRQGRIWG